ncbi:MAG: choice-of-anchor D domain-containing protein, partial [Pseudomonadota bacterium]
SVSTPICLPRISSCSIAAGLAVQIDPRLTLLNVNGASCNQDGQTLVCAIPDLNPIGRGLPDGLPPIDRLVTITTLPDPSLTIGTTLRSSASLSADQRNRNQTTQLQMERFVVAAADFIVNSSPADTVNANPGNGLCADSAGNCSLRAALEEAAALGGSRSIALSSSLYRLDLGALQIQSPVEIIGLGIGQTEIISDTNQPIFQVAAGGALTLQRLSLTGTQSSGLDGGLITNRGTVLIEDALLQNGRSVIGGAIWNDGGVLTVRRSALIDNRAVDGGGTGGAIFNGGSTVLENVLMHGNQALSGGAISSDAGTGATLFLRDSTIINNRANAIGAALFGEFSSLPMATLERTIVSGNTAVNPGGGGCLNQLISAGNNIVNDDLEGCSFAVQSGDMVGVDPALKPLIVGFDGRPVVEPTVDSPAVDAVAGPCAADTDLRRLPRPQDGDSNGSAACDIGAFELGLAAAIELTPATIDFGAVNPGTASAPLSVRLQSSGNLPLQVLSITRAPAPFQALAGSCPTPPFSLAAGSSCMLRYRFVPVDSEPMQADLNLVSNADQAAPVIELIGNVNRPTLSLSTDAIDFGDRPIGMITDSPLVFADNLGNSNLNIGSIQIMGPAANDFELTPGTDQCSGQSIEPASSCVFGVRFTPTTEGILQAQLMIPSNDPNGTRVVALRGTSGVLFTDSFERK